MKMTSEEACKGCKDYDSNYYSSFGGECLTDVAIESLSKVKCPCSICLIKGICEESCDLFNEYDKLLILEGGSNIVCTQDPIK
jgi:hypothetical protein